MRFEKPLIACTFKLVWLTCFWALSACASDEFSVRIFPDRASYVAGDTAVLALECQIPKNFHLYGNPLGPGIGKPLCINAAGDTAIRFLEARKCAPKKFDPELGGWVWAYQKQALFFIKARISSGAAGTMLRGKVTLDGLICFTSCIPVKRVLDFSLPIGTGEQPVAPAWRKRFGGAFKSAAELSISIAPCKRLDTLSNQPSANLQGLAIAKPALTPVKTYQAPVYHPKERAVHFNILLAIFFGFIAGIILNAMPCVLPVLGLKVISLTQGNAGDRKKAITKSLVFSAGMLALFMVLATLAAFAQLSWGQQFQKPAFLSAIICIVFVFALGLFDLYFFSIPGSSGILGAGKSPGYWQDFFGGIVATLLATPCSGPFLGATLAWTLTQPALVIYLIFTAIGCGMAFPYVLIAASRGAAKLMPRPGRWMEDLKHAMGFLLFAAALYLCMGLPGDFIVSTLGMCLTLSVVVAIFHRFVSLSSSRRRRVLVWILGAILCAAGFYTSFFVVKKIVPPAEGTVVSRENMLEWQDFSAAKLLKAHADSQNVLVDFTANWCLNCQYNFITVLNSGSIKELVTEKRVVTLKADLTGVNPEAENLMHSLGSRSVPFLAVFPGDDPGHPVIMRDILNKKALQKTLEKLH
jgi:thiol:disulfide interchange protein